jgi:hypothetical protein
MNYLFTMMLPGELFLEIAYYLDPLSRFQLIIANRYLNKLIPKYHVQFDNEFYKYATRFSTRSGSYHKNIYNHIISMDGITSKIITPSLNDSLSTQRAKLIWLFISQRMVLQDQLSWSYIHKRRATYKTAYHNIDESQIIQDFNELILNHQDCIQRFNDTNFRDSFNIKNVFTSRMIEYGKLTWSKVEDTIGALRLKHEMLETTSMFNLIPISNVTHSPINIQNITKSLKGLAYYINTIINSDLSPHSKYIMIILPQGVNSTYIEYGVKRYKYGFSTELYMAVKSLTNCTSSIAVILDANTVKAIIPVNHYNRLILDNISYYELTLLYEF